MTTLNGELPVLLPDMPTAAKAEAMHLVPTLWHFAARVAAAEVKARTLEITSQAWASKSRRVSVDAAPVPAPCGPIGG